MERVIVITIAVSVVIAVIIIIVVVVVAGIIGSIIAVIWRSRSCSRRRVFLLFWGRRSGNGSINTIHWANGLYRFWGNSRRRGGIRCGWHCSCRRFFVLILL